MKKLGLIVLMLTFLGCAGSPQSPQGPQGHYIKGVYISTHISEGVDFCLDRGNVDRMIIDGRTPDWADCMCHDGSIKQIPVDPYAYLNHD